MIKITEILTIPNHDFFPGDNGRFQTILTNHRAFFVVAFMTNLLLIRYLQGGPGSSSKWSYFTPTSRVTLHPRQTHWFSAHGYKGLPSCNQPQLKIHLARVRPPCISAQANLGFRNHRWGWNKRNDHFWKTVLMVFMVPIVLYMAWCIICTINTCYIYIYTKYAYYIYIIYTL